MSSKTGKPQMRSAAWRISLWATIAFACGTMVVFLVLQQFVAAELQRHTDAWLAGEVGVLGDVANRTPKGHLYGRVVREIAELASREVPGRHPGPSGPNTSVFFLQTGADGSMGLWVGAGNGQANLEAIRKSRALTDQPADLHVPGFSVPFRVASISLQDGSRIYLGVSEHDELRVLHKLRWRFLLISFSLVLFVSLIVFFATRRMLSHVRSITETASKIGHADLTTRVPTTRRHDEIAQLACTLNRMLDRIENSVRQLHTITDSLAHDLRSPLTAMRGKLEMALPSMDDEQAEPIVATIEELDRLTDFLNKSLDVAEAQADALRLAPTVIDLCELLSTMVALYEPSMSDKGLVVKLRCDGHIRVLADAALIHRMIANLLDNDLKHLCAGTAVSIEAFPNDGFARLIIKDNGPGFDSDILAQLFETRVKGRNSTGHGLGLAFVHAVARAHGGTVVATNRETGGTEITVSLPITENPNALLHQPAISGVI